MNKQTQNLLMIGALIAGGLYFGPKILAKARGTSDEDAPEIDAVVNTEDSGMSVPDAINEARQFMEGKEDAAVLVRTPGNEPDIIATKGTRKNYVQRFAQKIRERKQAKKAKRVKRRTLKRGALYVCKGKKGKARKKCMKDAAKIQTIQPWKAVM